MTDTVLLDNVTHKDVKIITRQGEAFGDAVNCVLTFPGEYADIQREYPILFRKDGETGAYQSIALLGFDKGENLFLGARGWTGNYVPGVIARGPFLIGFQQREVGGELRREPVVHIDTDDPRVSETEGEPVFLPHGGNTPYLERIAGILQKIHTGMAESRAMFSAFTSFDLVEPVDIRIEIHRDLYYDLNGYFTVSEEKLVGLGGAALEKLNRAGFLQAAFMVKASLNNVSRLIEMKRKGILEKKRTGKNLPLSLAEGT